MRHVRLDELSGSSLAEQVIIAVHLHEQRKKEFAGGHATPFVCLGRVFFWFGDDDAFRRGAAATMDAGSFQALEEVPVYRLEPFVRYRARD